VDRVGEPGAGSLPIGAVVTDARGKVLSRGHNRIHEGSGPPGAVFRHKLAHAELNALRSLDPRENDPSACVLWTTAEPRCLANGLGACGSKRARGRLPREPLPLQ